MTLTKEQIGRFWQRMDLSRGPDECWPWLGCVRADGYGRLRIGGRDLYAHRVAYILEKGIPGNLCIYQVCDSPRCCNPKHSAVKVKAGQKIGRSLEVTS